MSAPGRMSRAHRAHRTASAWLVAATLLAATLILPAALARPRSATAQDDAPAFRSGGRMVRGTVTAVSPDHLTVQSEDGQIFQVVLSPNTRLRKGRDEVKLDQVHPGDGVGAMGELDPATKSVHALFVGVVDAEQLRQARANLGKTYIAGSVVAVSGTSITVLRGDNQRQTITVDEDTSFRRGGRGMRGGFGGPAGGFEGSNPGSTPNGDSRAGRPDRPDHPHPPRPVTADDDLTLADVKPGDRISGPGTVKNGSFVPTELRIFDPATAHQGHHRAGQSGSVPPPAGPAGPPVAEPQ